MAEDKAVGVAGTIDPTLETYTEPQLNQLILKALPRLSDEHKKGLVTASVDRLPLEEKKAIAEALPVPAPLPEPGEKTRNAIWLVGVCSFAAVLVGSFLALAIGMFNSNAERLVKPELVLAVFTAVSGFVAGLFAPSPVAKKKEG